MVLRFGMIGSVPRSWQAWRKGFAVVALVGEQHGEASSGPAAAPHDGREAVEQVEGTADVRHVRIASEHVDRGADAVADQVMPGAVFAAVDRRRACASAPFVASM